jgi:geranylgeranyl pyrophosphate synthase
MTKSFIQFERSKAEEREDFCPPDLHALWLEAHQILPEVEKSMRVCAGPSTFLAPASEHHLGARGKRWRPLLCVTVSRALSLDRLSAIYLAASLELIHNASLVHDDLVDRDTQRRGRESVWSAFGEATALNLGDLYLTGAFLALARLPSPGAMLQELLALYSESVRRIINGHARELHQTRSIGVSLDDYIAMARAKSGVLLALPVTAPLTLAQADAEEVMAAGNAMELVGVAYQMLDDIHDVMGLKAGREAGGDVRERRMSLPAIVFSALASDHERLRFDRFLRWTSDATASVASEDASVWLQRFRQNDVLERCQSHYESIQQSIHDELSKLSLPLRTLLEQSRDQLLPREFPEEPLRVSQPDPAAVREPEPGIHST